jgi:hypothetical protein
MEVKGEFSAVDLQIDRLVLDGFQPLDRAALAHALEAELARLIGVQGLPPQLASPGAARLDGGSFELPPGASPAELGQSIAHGLYRGLGGG